MALPMSYGEFPVQEKPIYDFFVQDTGHIACVKHYTWMETPCGLSPSSQTGIRIHTGNNVSVKKKHQMDVFLNGHYFSFSPEREPAVRAILDSYTEKQKKAEADAARYKDRIKHILTAEHLGPDTGSLLDDAFLKKARADAMRKFLDITKDIPDPGNYGGQFTAPFRIRLDNTGYHAFLCPYSVVLTTETLPADITEKGNTWTNLVLPSIQHFHHVQTGQDIKPFCLNLQKIFTRTKKEGYRLSKNEVYGSKNRLHLVRTGGETYRTALMEAAFSIIDEGKSLVQAFLTETSPKILILKTGLGFAAIMPYHNRRQNPRKPDHVITPERIPCSEPSISQNPVLENRPET